MTDFFDEEWISAGALVNTTRELVRPPPHPIAIQLPRSWPRPAPRRAEHLVKWLIGFPAIVGGAAGLEDSHLDGSDTRAKLTQQAALTDSCVTRHENQLSLARSRPRES